MKENTRNKRYHEVIPPKEVPATGHYLDRRSGTGRVDRPRKEGGGRGNIGNVKDELNADKYIKEGEVPVEGAEEEVKPEEPQGITLDEYYKNKGIELSTAATKKEATKKGEVNAEWIKKEKLTVLQTKEDKKAAENQEQVKKTNKRQGNEKVANNNLNSELLGFNSVPLQQPREERQPREDRPPREHREHREPR